MIDVNALIKVIHANGYSQRKVAKAIGMTEQRFYRCMKKGVVGSDYIEKLIVLLNIKNPVPIFFTSNVTYKDTESSAQIKGRRNVSQYDRK